MDILSFPSSVPFGAQYLTTRGAVDSVVLHLAVKYNRYGHIHRLLTYQQTLSTRLESLLFVTLPLHVTSHPNSAWSLIHPLQCCLSPTLIPFKLVHQMLNSTKSFRFFTALYFEMHWDDEFVVANYCSSAELSWVFRPCLQRPECTLSSGTSFVLLLESMSTICFKKNSSSGMVQQYSSWHCVSLRLPRELVYVLFVEIDVRARDRNAEFRPSRYSL